MLSAVAVDESHSADLTVANLQRARANLPDRAVARPGAGSGSAGWAWLGRGRLRVPTPVSRQAELEAGALQGDTGSCFRSKGSGLGEPSWM